MRLLLLFVLLCCPAIVLGQENVRHADRPGTHTKYLTSGQLDTWLIDLEANDTIMAHVQTHEFDPVLELADKTDQVLISRDDEGSESRFALRVAAAGEYRVRVYAFHFQGGGNYALQLRKFAASRYESGINCIGKLDRDGRVYHHFTGRKSEIVIPDLRGNSSLRWEMYDGDGASLNPWSGTVLLQKDGDHYIEIEGAAGEPYSLLLREARQCKLEADKQVSGKLEAGEMEVWNFAGDARQFCCLDLTKRGAVITRLLPIADETRKKMASRLNLPDIRAFPVSSKGDKIRFASLLGRRTTYQLFVLAQSAVNYQLLLHDPTRTLPVDARTTGTIGVGESNFGQFEARAGQLLEINLRADNFDPCLRLYNAQGDLVAENDDGGDNLESRIAVLVKESGLYRLHIAAVGNGGGGAYELSIKEQPIPTLAIGERREGFLGNQGEAYWAFSGKRGQTFFISVRSSEMDPVAYLFAPSGVMAQSDDNSGVGSDALLAVTLAEDGRHTLLVRSQRGAGKYAVRVFED